MTAIVAESVLDERDQRLVAALQCDGRLTAERAAEVLGLSTRVVRRQWATLLGERVIRVVGVPSRPDGLTAMVLRIKVLRGKVESITRALTAREDIPFIDLSAAGDELIAVAITPLPGPSRLLFEQLPATSAVTSVEAQTILHGFLVAAPGLHAELVRALP